MNTGCLFMLGYAIGVGFYSLAVWLAKVPATRELAKGSDIHQLKKFHDDRGFDLLKLFIQMVVATGGALGLLVVNGKGAAIPGLREAGQWTVGGAGYLLAITVVIHKASKVWAAGQSFFVSWLSAELFTVPGMVALTTVLVFRIVPALVKS